MNILIVDDDSIKIQKIQTVITECRLSITIHTVHNNADAMELLWQKQFDLMVLDLNLPFRDGEDSKLNAGISLLKDIDRCKTINKPTEIIGLTALTDAHDLSVKYFQIRGWLLIKMELKESDWEEILKNKITYTFDRLALTQIIPEMTNISSLPQITVLTAIKEEYIAVRMLLENINDRIIDDTSYERGIFKFDGKAIAEVTIRECGQNNNTAAIETERAIQYLKPECMLFVGIAGARKDLKVGDVVFPNKIYYYESGKAERETFNARPETHYSSYKLSERAKIERLKEDWKALIPSKYSELIQDTLADIGVIASGEQLIEHYESSIGQILTQYYNDTAAVEMEGFGFANAISRQGSKTSNILVGIIRGISDIIERSSSNGDESKDRRPGNTKEFAAATAAAFAFWLIKKIYE